MNNPIAINPQTRWPNALSDVRMWIVLFFLVRMYGITYPPLELEHSWRQTDGLMIARNFYERDANIFYPRVDLAGEKSGIIGCEFPILNYLIFLAAKVFGYAHWYGRLIVLITSSFGVFFFHEVIRRYFNRSVALNASIVLMASLWFSYGRKIVPDVFAASLAIIALHYAVEFLEQGKWWRFLLFLVFALTACLSKILAASLLTPLAFLIAAGRIPMNRKIVLTVGAVGILGCVVGWYFFWVPYLNTFGYGDHFFMGMNYADGLSDIANNLRAVLFRLAITPSKYSGFVIFVIALILAIRHRLWIGLGVFMVAYFSFFLMIVKTGNAMIGDKYYILTSIPACAFLIGLGIEKIPKPMIMILAVFAACGESLGDQFFRIRIREPFKSLSTLEGIMDSVSDRNDLVAINGELHNPTAMYFAHRRGWAFENWMVEGNSSFIDSIQSRGCKFVVIAKKLYGDVALDLPVAHESEFFKIYKLDRSVQSSQ